ncbi:DNRLRE domain-containing protein [Lysinibacillus sp. KU-BSD001]|uniref:DNRLRE domain-containing protein n=1 Tax=Lysinibacillus sp. KU-BSD001 TaxID=3141328 RepID=UPI0036E77970
MELVEERTALSKTYDNLDGTLSTEITQIPQHYQDNNGQWKEIKNDLVPSKKGKFKNADNAFTVEFNEKLTSQSTGLQVHEDTYNVNLQLTEVVNNSIESLQPSTGEVKDNQISYSEIFEDISATYTVGENYVKEDIILESYPKNGLPEKFTYTLDLKGLSYKAIDNTIYLYNPETNQSVYMIEAPFMYDAYKPTNFKTVEGVTSVPEEAKSYDIQMNTREKNNQLFIDLIPNQKWLSAKERQYPIVIDPMIVRLQDASENETDATVSDTTIRSNFPTTTGGNDFELGIGTASDGNIVRSLLKFNLTSIPTAVNILSADLSLHLTSTNNAATGININAHAMTSTWEENEASWTYREITPYTKWATAGGDYSSTPLSTVSGITAVPTIENGLTRWNIPVSSIEKWVNTPSSNYGILLKSANESTKVYKKFASSAYSTTTQYKPKLVITYKTPSRLGLESYWDYTSHPLNDGTQYINLGTLNNILQYNDVSLLNYADFGLDFTRTYNSKDVETSAFGVGWSFTGDQKLYIGTEDNGVYYKDEDGTTHLFEDTSTTSVPNYKSPVGIYDKLTKISNTEYLLTSPEGIKTLFTVRESAKDTDVKIAYITNQQDLNGNTITYSYNTKHQLTSIHTNADSTNQKITLTYNLDGYIASVTKKDKKFTYSYTDGFLTSVTEKKSATENLVTTFTYEKTAKKTQISKVTDPSGYTTTFTYTSNLDIASVSANGSIDATTKYVLDRTVGEMLVTSPEGLATKYFLNSNFVITGILLPSGEQKSYTLDANYNVTKEVTNHSDGTSYTKNYTYNGSGNVLTTLDSSNVKTATTYNSFQSPLTSTDEQGHITTYTYDSKNNLVSTKTTNNEITTFAYSANGELVKITSPKGDIQTFTTDFVNGGKTTTNTDDALGTSSTSVTDSEGNLISSTDGKGQVTTYTYNRSDQLLTVKDAANKITNYVYDANGNLTTVTNAANAQTKLAYTAKNQVQSETNALNQVITYGYNEDGDLTSIKKANGDLISYETNVETGQSSTKLNGVIAYTTTEKDLVTTSQQLLNNQTVQYKALENGLLSTIRFNNLDLNQITYTYDNEQLATLSYGSNSLIYAYDANNQVTSLKNNATLLATFNYDANGLNTKTAFGNGKSAIENDYVLTQADGTTKNSSQLQKEKMYTTSSTTPWLTNTYKYDKNGQILGITNTRGTTNYVYDEVNQLTQEQLADGQVINYKYDAVGNRTAKSIVKNGVTTTTNYTFNAANQMTKAGSQAYTVDVNGNLTNDGHYQYTWNVLDQLTAVKTTAGATVATYQYDENGRRIYSKVGSTETYYRYDGTSNHVLFEENASGTVTKAYTYDLNGHPLTMTYHNQTYNYLTNYRGDVLALTDVNGTVVAEYTYDAWGNILTQTGTMASVNPYRYASYRYDEETKLYYLMARYYNPDTGVFLSLDAYRGDKEMPITMNGYNYANNNPIIFVDTDGNNPVLIKLLQYTVIPILKYLAKRYGPKLMKELNYIVSSNINKYIKKYTKDYNINFGKGNLVSIVKKSGKGDRRIFSFEYASVYFGKRKENAWHYHLGNPKQHYVFRWNEQYRKGYTFSKIQAKTHFWVW